jgi:drug/metabolite transporter (DMT)-like permease
MTTVAHDTRRSRTAAGIGLAMVSATSFGLSGALARGLMDAGWSAGAAVTARILLAAAVLVVPGVTALRGRWSLLGRHLPVVLWYGAMAVAATQLCYFYAVAHLQVGVALLIEYTAPVAVVLWLWLRHGQRPGALTLVGASVAALGLVLVLDVVSGSDLSLVGVLWGLGAMLGVATYFVMSADERHGIPGITLAAAGLTVGGAVLALAGAVGLLPMHATSSPTSYAVGTTPWWVPVLLLGLVTAALAYVTGIAASRRLGSRLASFVGLAEVMMALVFAWLLLDELPHAWQLAGGVLVLAGVVVVRLGEEQVGDTPVDGTGGLPPDPVSGRPAA